LARRISVGLKRMLKDGSFEHGFQTFKSKFEAEIGFRDRLLIRVENPLQTPETPLDRPELWYDPKADK
jgi:hypothetical protein